MTKHAALYAGHRYPAAVIAHAVRLYFRFPLSLVEEILAERGIVVSHETIRQWGLKFGKTYAAETRRRQSATGDKWHLDEVVISTPAGHTGSGALSTRMASCSTSSSRAAATREPPSSLLRKLMKRQRRAPRVMITAKLRSYGAAARTIMPEVEHRQHKALNNRAENSHQPTRRRSGS